MREEKELHAGKRKSLLASISETVQTILEKHPNGLLCSKLPSEYQLRTGSDLALSELGFHSVLDLVSLLPLRIIKSNAFGDWLLFTLRQPLPDFVNDQTQADDGLIAEVEDDSRLQEAKERIRDILLSFPDGLRMSSLEDHYQMNCNERLPYGALGFNSLETFVLQLTEDVLNLKNTADGLKLYPIMPPQSETAVSRDLYPADAVGPGRSFERVKLPDVPSGEYNLEIFVAEVYHPHKFWFHLVGDQYADALEKLMDEMEMTYCTTLGFKYRMQEATVRVGQVCACPYGEQGYHRAVITGVRPVPEPVKVFYVDYGSVGTVSREMLRFLPEQYFSLPAQALLGRLANIEPPDAEGWSREASKTFLSLVDNNRILYAMILERSPSCVSLCLCDTTGDTDLHVNDRLVELDYAVFHNESVDVDEKSEPAGGRSTPSDIDRLLLETLGSPPGNAGPPPAPVPLSSPGQPPGFAAVSPLPPVSTTAFAQMLTQSALLSNLQMMQLNLMNPMMNPAAYAALLMSQASGAGGGVTAVPTSPTVSAVSPAALTTVAPAAVSAVAPTTPVSAAGRAPEAPAAAGVPTSAEVAPAAPPPLAPSVDGSGRNAGVCIAAPTQADRWTAVPVGVVHLICLDGAGYLVSAEISHFLWTRDILHTMLLMKRVTLPSRSVDVESHQELFAELIKYKVPGVMNGEDLVDPLTIYPITCVPRVFTVFKNMKNEHDVNGIINDIIAEFDPADPYWSTAANDEDDEAELADLGLGDGLQRGALSADGAAERAVPAAGVRAGERWRPPLMGLEGTDFSPEDVIGDELRKMDAQIASFQRRIDALVASRAAAVVGRPGSQQGSVCQPGSQNHSTCRPASARTSISMNPDAPEFIHPSQTGRGAPQNNSACASKDSTICLPGGDEPAVSKPRVSVELRAPDGTPVQLSQLVSGAETARRSSVSSTGPSPPRRPLELRTPDGKPVQLSASARAASTPHGSPPPLSVSSGATVTVAATAAAPTPAAAAVAPVKAQSAPQQYQIPLPPAGHQPTRYGPPTVQPLRPVAPYQQPTASRFQQPQATPQQPPAPRPQQPPPLAPVQQQQQQWPRLPSQMPIYQPQPYLAFPQMYQPTPGMYPRFQQPMGYLGQPLYSMQSGFQPAASQYSAPAAHQPPPAGHAHQPPPAGHAPQRPASGYPGN
ncbi:Tudor domain-containing protein 5 [Amphibalanus amphitrite]|uniref:Tudor domain-containing protein 5 n=1 Tax=Amphibalanus amphitrite TaxID=1232801 RepID=A0A6A4VBP0_AMPAM|nr:Tudor domain-containing protein 5 [Amphibalanus amphitrite]